MIIEGHMELPSALKLWADVTTWFGPLFIAARRAPKQPDTHEDADLKELDTSTDGDSVNCLNCGKLITHLSEVMEHDGAHLHQFTNPLGISSSIRIFRSAPGCSAKDAPVLEYTWFPGFAWQAGYCTGCGLHLGWRYTNSSGSTFYGLIADMITQTE